MTMHRALAAPVVLSPGSRRGLRRNELVEHARRRRPPRAVTGAAKKASGKPDARPRLEARVDVADDEEADREDDADDRREAGADHHRHHRGARARRRARRGRFGERVRRPGREPVDGGHDRMGRVQRPVGRLARASAHVDDPRRPALGPVVVSIDGRAPTPAGFRRTVNVLEQPLADGLTAADYLRYTLAQITRERRRHRAGPRHHARRSRRPRDDCGTRPRPA